MKKNELLGNENNFKVCFIGNYLPRQCGIATFTYDLRNAVSKNLYGNGCRVIAMNNTPEGYKYLEEVIFEIQQSESLDYYLAAEYINSSPASIVCLQHEFGIFGGEGGNFIFKLIDNIKKPLVATLHTVSNNFKEPYHSAFLKLLNKSSALVVMSNQAKEILSKVYKIKKNKIFIVYHGTPDVKFLPPDFYKEKFTDLKLKNKFVFLTFGFLSPNKGIEVMLDALSLIVKKYPQVIYIVAGKTHPEVKKIYGDAYLNKLKKKVKQLKLENNVIFYNEFLNFNELCNFIGMADVFVTPYLSGEQIVSGTLSYALAMGKAIISTPYWYAQEMLAENKGKLVDFGDYKNLAKKSIKLIRDEKLLNQMRKKAYNFGRKMIWDEVGKKYVEVFKKILTTKTNTIKNKYQIASTK